MTKSSDIGRRNRILIVDDEPLNRDLLRRVLRSRFPAYEVDEAENVPRALDCLEAVASSTSLILCDQLMPGDSGTELARIVSLRWPEVSFLLLTGYDSDAAVADAFDKGYVSDVVPKPWRVAELWGRLKEFL